MTKNSRTKYKQEYSDKNYDRYTILFPKGQKSIFKKAAAATGMSLNEFMIANSRKSAVDIIASELDKIRNFDFTEKATPCHTANIVFYIDCTSPSGFPREPIRIAVVNFDTGAILYRGEFKTFYTEDSDTIDGADTPTAEDISLIKGYLNCESIFTYDIDRLHSLTEAWGLEIKPNHIQSLNRIPLMEAIGMKDTKERDVRPFEIAQKLRDYAMKTL